MPVSAPFIAEIIWTFSILPAAPIAEASAEYRYQTKKLQQELQYNTADQKRSWLLGLNPSLLLRTQPLHCGVRGPPAGTDTGRSLIARHHRPRRLCRVPRACAFGFRKCCGSPNSYIQEIEDFCTISLGWGIPRPRLSFWPPVRPIHDVVFHGLSNPVLVI
jgi:hypothetical protein